MATELTKTGVNAHDAIFQRGSATGATAMDHKFTVPSGKAVRVRRAGLKFSAAPTTSENFVIGIDSDLGAAYDNTVYSVDPSAVSATQIVLDNNDLDTVFYAGEVITFAYTNTDTRTWGLVVEFEEA